jgi:hypothetical protein
MSALVMLDTIQRLGTPCPNTEQLYHRWQKKATLAL